MPINEEPMHHADVIEAQRAARATAGVAGQTNHPSAHGLWQGKEIVRIEFDAIVGPER
jgi:hypothetical protein